MPSIVQVRIVCKTCEHTNRQRLGERGFVLRQTDFESLTDAWFHIWNTHNEPDDLAHELVLEAEVKD